MSRAAVRLAATRLLSLPTQTTRSRLSIRSKTRAAISGNRCLTPGTFPGGELALTSHGQVPSKLIVRRTN
jgi:hypothetical protein